MENDVPKRWVEVCGDAVAKRRAENYLGRNLQEICLPLTELLDGRRLFIGGLLIAHYQADRSNENIPRSIYPNSICYIYLLKC